MVDDKKLSVVANAIGFEMLRHDGRPTRLINGVEGIDVTAEEAARSKVAAATVLDHLAQYEANHADG